MDQIEVHPVGVQALQARVERAQRPVAAMIVVPDLRGDEYLAALEPAFGDPLCHLGLVVVHRGRVDQPVARLQRTGHRIGGVVRRHFKDAETQLWNAVAVV
jgi:hypothetical protein